MNMQKKIYELMEKYNLFGEIVEETENKIAIEITWGDWKHEHLRLDWIMQENFSNIQSIHTYTTEEDGGDCYSAIHYYYFY